MADNVSWISFICFILMIQSCNSCNTLNDINTHLESIEQGYLNNQMGYYNPKDYVTREHFDKTIEELRKLITGLKPVEKKD